MNSPEPGTRRHRSEVTKCPAMRMPTCRRGSESQLPAPPQAREKAWKPHRRGLGSSGASAVETLSGSTMAPHMVPIASARQMLAGMASLDAVSSRIPIRDARDAQLVRSSAFGTIYAPLAPSSTLEHPRAPWISRGTVAPCRIMQLQHYAGNALHCC